MPRAFEGQEAFQYQKISKEEQERRGILGRLIGKIADPNKPTRNGRLYSRQLWEKVLADPIFNEKLLNKLIWGELEHPADGRTTIDYKNAAVCLAEKPVFGKDGFLYGVFDIVQTECGKLLKILLDYGSTFAISSRGDGELFTNMRGQEEVDPDSYQCFTFDIVGVPGVKEARLTPVMESYDGSSKTFTEELAELVNKSNNKELLTETLNSLGINLTEDVDYVELANEANKLLGDKYGDVTSNNSLRNALKQAIELNESDDIQTISKLILKYDKDFTDSHDKINLLANNGVAEKPVEIENEPVEMIDDTEDEEQPEATDILADQQEPIDDLDLIDQPDQLPEQDVLDNEQAELPLTYDDNATESLNEDDVASVNESKDWTAAELKKASELMQKLGFMSFDEFKQAFESGKFDQSQQQQSAEDIDEVENNSNDGNAMTEIVNTLQETLLEKQNIESRLYKLNESISVCYAKEAKLEAEIVSLKEELAKANKLKTDLYNANNNISRQKSLLSEANSSIRGLNEKCSEIVTKYNSLAEKYNNKLADIKTLTEDLNSKSKDIVNMTLRNNKLAKLVEDISANLKDKEASFNESLSKSNALVEKYKAVANRAVAKYIESQAVKLGISANEIKNRLPKNYSFNNIDTICENLQREKVSINSLPFKAHSKFYENMSVQLRTKQTNPIVNVESNSDDDVDDSLLKLANITH